MYECIFLPPSLSTSFPYQHPRPNTAAKQIHTKEEQRTGGIPWTLYFRCWRIRPVGIPLHFPSLLSPSSTPHPLDTFQIAIIAVDNPQYLPFVFASSDSTVSLCWMDDDFVERIFYYTDSIPREYDRVSTADKHSNPLLLLRLLTAYIHTSVLLSSLPNGLHAVRSPSITSHSVPA